MTAICNDIIDHPSAWTASSFAGKSDLTLRLGDRRLDAIDRLLRETRHLRPQQVTRAQFSDPALTPFLAEVFDIIMNGRGIVVVAGVTHERYSEEEFERIFWGFGTHFGHAVVQSPDGDRLGHVRFTPVGPDNPAQRAYRGNDELVMHVDSQELVGLMCVQKAKAGGASNFVSSIAVHNELLARHADLLPPLYEGYFLATNEAMHTDNPLTDFKVPVFCYVDGRVSCALKGTGIRRAGKLSGGLPGRLEEAMDAMQAITSREDMRLNFTLDAGEMALWNNFTVLHARTAFEDYDEPARKRHLLRLWLDIENGRPVIPVYRRDLVAGSRSY